MNYQRKPPEEVIRILEENNAKYVDIAYYAWPETFGSTCGPCRGIGGQSMSTFTVEAWVCDDCSPTVYTCSGMYRYDDGDFQIFREIRNWRRIPR